jgi:hypothetical protein
LKLDLHHSNEALATLQSLYDEKVKFCEGLMSRNLKLYKDAQDAKSHVQVLEEEKVKIEKSAAEQKEEIERYTAEMVAAIEEGYNAYHAEVKKDMVALRVAYELALNGIGATCLPIDDASSSSDDFFQWFESEVASLPDVFAGINENFVAIALEGVLNMLKLEKCAHIDVLHKGVLNNGFLLYSS